MFTSLLCSHTTFCINHYMVILIRLACLFAPPTTYHMLSLVIMFTHAYSRRVITHALHSFSPSKSQRSMKVCTAFLVACIGYHGNDYKQTMIEFIHFFPSTMIESFKNMIPNVLLRNGGLSKNLC